MSSSVDSENRFSNGADSANFSQADSLVFRFISINFKGEFELAEEAREILSKSGKKLSVVSVVGPTGSGKSLLVNLLASKKDGLAVSSNKQPCTREIWGILLPGEDKDVLLVDSEGLKMQKFKKKLFSLLFSISSTFIYNSMGTVTEDSIEFLAQVSSGISRTGFPPKFIWLLRDFTQIVTGFDGVPIPLPQYIEELVEFGSIDSRSSAFVQLKRIFLEVLTDRDCFALPEPVSENTEIPIQDLPFHRLEPDFCEEFEKLKRIAVTDSRPKQVEGVEINGKLLCKILKPIIRCVKYDNEVNSQEILQVMSEATYNQIEFSMKEKFRSQRITEMLPMEEVELMDFLHSFKHRCFMMFKDCDLPIEQYEKECRKRMNEFFDTEFRKVLDMNSQVSKIYNHALVCDIFKDIICKLESEFYAEQFLDLEHDWNTAYSIYRKNAKGPGKFETLMIYLEKHQQKSFFGFLQTVIQKYSSKLEDFKNNSDSSDQEEMPELENHNIEDNIHAEIKGDYSREKLEFLIKFIKDKLKHYNLRQNTQRNNNKKACCILF